MPRLRISRPGEPARDIALAGEVSIGRHPHNVVSLLDGAVSADHARIVVGDDDSYIEDLGSSNGTLVEGRRAAPHEHVTLHHGERCVIGSCTLSFVDDTHAVPASPDDLPAPHNVRSREPQIVRVLAYTAFFSCLFALATVVIKQIV